MSSNSSEPSRIPLGQSSAAAIGFSAAVDQTGKPIHLNNSAPGILQVKRKIRPIDIKRIVRRVRGGSQARLVEGQDGRFYVAKFAGNPQGNRTLVNEWIAQFIMAELSISAPPLHLLRLPETLRNEELYFDVGNEKIPVAGEWHLGSLCPVNPETKVIFDFLPRRLLDKVANLEDFAKIFVVDRWLGQLDQRQAIFVRDRECPENQTRFRAHFIDHGMIFAGPSWELPKTVGHGLYFDPVVYSLVNMSGVCEETASQIEALTEERMFGALATLPACWLSAGDEEELNRLVKTLCQSRVGLRGMIFSQIASLDLKPWSCIQENEDTRTGTKVKRTSPTGQPSTATRVA